MAGQQRPLTHNAGFAYGRRRSCSRSSAPSNKASSFVQDRFGLVARAASRRLAGPTRLPLREDNELEQDSEIQILDNQNLSNQIGHKWPALCLDGRDIFWFLKSFVVEGTLQRLSRTSGLPPKFLNEIICNICFSLSHIFCESV